MDKQILQKNHTDYTCKYKSIWYTVREHHANQDRWRFKHRCITFAITIQLKYMHKKYKSFWLSKEKKHGLLDYPHRNLECFFSGSDDLYSFRTELGYELTGYYKLRGFEDGDDKVVELAFSADDCWNGNNYDDSTFTVEQASKEADQAIDAFLQNVPDYCPIEQHKKGGN
jgi:hypothetical protein